MQNLIEGVFATGKGAFRPGSRNDTNDIRSVIDPVLLAEMDADDDYEDEKVRCKLFIT